MSLSHFASGGRPVFGAAVPHTTDARADTSPPPADPDVPVETDDGSFELAETNNIRIVKAEELPRSFKFSEKDACYDDRFTNLLNFHYRGEDEPQHGKSGGGRLFTDETPVSVICMDDQKYLPPGVPQIWQDDLKARPKDSLVTLKWHLNSQHPAIILRIKRDNGKPNISVHIFTDNLGRTLQSDGDGETCLRLHSSGDESLVDALKRAGPETLTRAADENMCALTAELWDQYQNAEQPDPAAHGRPPKSRPMLTGIAPSVLQTIGAKHYKNAARCKDWEPLVVELFSAHAPYTFVRYWPIKDSQDAGDTLILVTSNGGPVVLETPAPSLSQVADLISISNHA